ncbi:MAG: DUF484 family protein [Gammaproteobacteria bacterium]
MKTLPGLSDESDEKEIVEYLRSHPEFFLTHTHLLTELAVPHDSGDSVSLIERQVVVLRDQNRQLKHDLMELVQIARDNDRLTERMQRFTLALLDAGTLSDILFTVHDAMRNDFNADLVAVRLFVPPQESVDESNAFVAVAFAEQDADNMVKVMTAFKKILDAGKPVCGKLTAAQAHYLFRERAGEIASSALVPLRKSSDEQEKCFGIMAIGSFSVERFHADMGTLFLNTMANTLSRTLTPYLKL